MSIANFAIARYTQSLGRFLPYWKTVEDFVLHVDGRITGGLSLKGISLQCLSDAELERHREQLKLFLHSLPQGVEVQFFYEVRPFSPLLTTYRRKADETDQDRFRFLWREKADYYEAQSNLWHTKLFLFVSVPDEKKKEEDGLFSRIRRSWRNTDLSNVFQTHKAWEESRRLKLKQALSEIRSALSYLEIPHENLTRSETLTLLYECLNPNRSRQIPLSGRAGENSQGRTLREDLVFSPLQAYPREMILDDTIHRVMTLRDIPQLQYPGIVNRLLNLREFPFNISVGLRVENPEKMVAAYKRAEILQANLQKKQGRNYEAEQSQAVLSEILQSLVKGDTKVFGLSFSIHYWASEEEELEEIEARLRQEIHQMGEAKELREEFDYPNIWIATLPGCSHQSYRRLETITPQTLSLLPIYQNSHGAKNPVALFKNRGDELVAQDPFDSRLTAYNGVIFGPTGRGKSFLAQYLLLQYLRLNPKIFIIDIGGSYRRFTKLLGGDYIDLQQSSPVSLNPFLPRDTEPEPELMGFLAGIVERMVKNEGQQHLDKIPQHLIRESIRHLYQKQARYPLNLDGFKRVLEDDSQAALDAEDKHLLKDLSKRLALWTEGEGRNLLVGETSLSLSKPVITIDLAGLSSNKELQGITIQILAGLVWHQIKKSPGPKIVLFDEVWQHLKDPTAAQLLDQLYRTARKHYASVFSISQQLEDFLSEENQTSIIANSATRFILRTDRETDLLKKIFQLNDAEISLIQGLTMRRGYFSEVFAAIGDDHLVLRIEPSPSEYWLCTTHPADLAQEAEFFKTNPQASLEDMVAALSQKYPRGYYEKN